jgi:hypothetical protein
MIGIVEGLEIGTYIDVPDSSIVGRVLPIISGMGISIRQS